MHGFTKLSLLFYFSSAYQNSCKREVRSMKMSSLQGIVRPPIGWWNPNSSSALFSKSWNEGLFKNDMGTTNRFFSLSPTYTAKKPFGTSANVEAACFVNEFDRRRMCLACIIPGKRIAIAIYLYYCSERWWRSQMKTEKGDESKDLIQEDLKIWSCYERISSDFICVIIDEWCRGIQVELVGDISIWRIIWTCLSTHHEELDSNWDFGTHWAQAFAGTTTYKGPSLKQRRVDWRAIWTNWLTSCYGAMEDRFRHICRSCKLNSYLYNKFNLNEIQMLETVKLSVPAKYSDSMFSYNYRWVV